MAKLAKELTVATAAAMEAAAVIRSHYGRGDAVQYKTPIEPVTEADVLADGILKARLLTAFPGDGWLSEETADDGARVGKRRVWIVDPLDGTREFIAGRPEFCVSVGLAIDGEPALGVIVNPITEECWTACLGGGAHVNGTPIHVSSAETSASVLVSRTETRNGLLSAVEGRLPLRAVGGMAYKLALVASGLADATFTTQHRCEWDIAAGLVVVTEAGGRVTSLDGAPFRLNQPSPHIVGLAASNGRCHEAVLEVLLGEQSPRP